MAKEDLIRSLSVKRVQKTRQPNRLLLTVREKLVNLRVQMTDWALRGLPWGALSFLAAYVLLLLSTARFLIGFCRRLPRLIETFQFGFRVVTHPAREVRSIGFRQLERQRTRSFLDLGENCSVLMNHR